MNGKTEFINFYKLPVLSKPTQEEEEAEKESNKGKEKPDPAPDISRDDAILCIARIIPPHSNPKGRAYQDDNGNEGFNYHFINRN